ncbi:hypothetical protein J3A83DRAFT_1499010 [Scleroderma citrinum]
MLPSGDHLFAGEKGQQQPTKLMEEPLRSAGGSSHSDSGHSLSPASSILGTPFDIGSQRFEYPFPQTQGSPADPFLPLSSSPTHTNLPHWPIHTPQAFLLSAPPPSRMKAHPKLHSTNAREPPVPPGLVKRLSAGLHYQTSEESSDRSDGGDPVPNNRRTTRPATKPSDAVLQRAPVTDNHSTHLRTASESPKVVKHKDPVQDNKFSDHIATEGTAKLAMHPNRSETLVNSSTVSTSTSILGSLHGPALVYSCHLWTA